MKCNKCSTPIIPGETRCRFCGSTIKKEKKEPEIIDIIDDTINESNKDEVLIKDNIEIKPEIIDIIDDDSSDSNIDVTDELEKTTKLEKIDIEEFTGKITKEELDEIETQAEEIDKALKKDDKKVQKKEEVQVQAEKKTEEPVLKKNRKKSFNECSNLYIVIIVIGVLLIISLIFNLFLFLNRNVTKKIDNSAISNETTKAYFNNYELNLPNNWFTKTDIEKNTFMFFDVTNEWAASSEIIKDVDFKQINKQADNIQTEYAKKGYIFTSNYTKNIQNVDYFLYKGKFETYSVYLIIRKIDDKNIIVTDLKFKGEIEKDVLDTILNSFAAINANNLSKLYENDFIFEANGSIIYNITKNTSLPATVK